MKEIKFGFFIKDLNFEKFPKIHISTILGQKKGVEGGVKKKFCIFSPILTQNTYVYQKLGF